MTTHSETRGVVPLGNSTINYIDAGRGHTILLGHSYLWDAEMWRPQIDALASHYRVIVPDLWGHGQSGPLPVDVTSTTDLARYYLEFLDQLEVKDFTVAGLSVGGMWAAEMAAMAPDRVNGLALLDTYVGPEPAASRQQYFALLSAVADRGEVAEALLDTIEPLFLASSTIVDKPVLAARFRAALRAMDPQVLRSTIVPLGRLIFGRADRRETLSGLNMPCLVMTGAQDRSRPPHEGREMAEIIECPFIEVPGAGHIAALEAPDAVNDGLIEVLRRIEHAGAGHAGTR